MSSFACTSSQFGEARHAPDDIPQPAEDPDTSGATGSTDDRSAENRREGLAKEPDDKLSDPDEG